MRPLLVPERATLAGSLCLGSHSNSCHYAPGSALSISQAFFFSHSINLTVSIYEIDIIRPVFQIREWKEAGVTIKSINSGARLSLCASPGSALGQLGDFGQGILPL